MSFDVFVSYPNQDKQTADSVCNALEEAGINCWVAPRNIMPGYDWGAAIVDAIASTKIMVLVFSRHSNASEQIKREVERAVHKGMPIIPFRIENITMSKSLEYFLSTPHWLDAMAPPSEAHLDLLVRSVKGLLSSGPEKSHSDPGLGITLGQFMFPCVASAPSTEDLTACISTAKTLGVGGEVNELLSEIAAGKRKLDIADINRIEALLKTKHGLRLAIGYFLGFRLKLLNSILVSGGSHDLLSNVGSQVLRAMQEFDAPIQLRECFTRNLIRATDRTKQLPSEDLVRFCDLLLIDLQNTGVTHISLLTLRRFLTGGMTVGDPGFLAAASSTGF